MKARKTFINQFVNTDVFNLEPKKILTSHSQKKINKTIEDTYNDIFSNKIQNNVRKSQKKIYVNKSQSDIFNMGPEMKKKYNSIKKYRSNKNNINIFSENSKDYMVKKPKIKEYNPDKYFSIDTASERFYKEYYDSNSRNKHKRIKGLFQTETTLKNNEKKTKENPNPIKKNITWTNENSLNIKMNTINSSPKQKKIQQLYSNIFYNKEKENQIEIEKNQNESQKKITKSKVNILNERKKKSLEKSNKKNNSKNINNNKEKLINKINSNWYGVGLDWKKPETALLFTKYNDSENEKKTAFERKQEEIKGTNNINNQSTKHFSGPKNKYDKKYNNNNNYDSKQNIKKSIEKNMKDISESKKRKYIDNATTSNLFRKDFFENNIKLKNKKDNKEYEYILTNTNKDKYHRNQIDELSIRRLFSQEGIHTYDINTKGDQLIGVGNNSYISFKIRENDDENFERKMKKIKERLLNENNVEISPAKKICVNRKNYDKNSNLKKSNSNSFYNVGKAHKKSFSNERFSDKFLPVDTKYKNNIIKCKY